MHRRTFMQGAMLTVIGAAVAGCVYDPHPGYGPPPHAPAHGYRYRHPHGVDLAYDAGLGVYVVIGRPRHYFWDGHYYRFYGDHWQWSPRLDGRWSRRERRTVPPGLRRRHPHAGPPGRGRRDRR